MNILVLHAILYIFQRNFYSFRLPISFYVCECLADMYVCVPQRSEKAIRYHGTGVVEGSKSSCQYWGLNWGPLQEQVLSTAEPPL